MSGDYTKNTEGAHCQLLRMFVLHCIVEYCEFDRSSNTCAVHTVEPMLDFDMNKVRLLLVPP